jgi:hypothetical protein
VTRGIAAAILILLVLSYPFSVGPVFAYYRQAETRAPIAFYYAYWPLFHVVPSSVLTGYLKLWGVSEIEAFFMFDVPQGHVEGK